MAKIKKGKKKKFFEVDIPIIRKTTQLQAYDIEDLEGRNIKYDLTRVLKGKSLELTLVVKVKNGKAIATPIKATLMPYFLRRMMRKGTNYVEDSIETNSKDSIVKIKPFLIARKKVSRAVRKALREKAKEELIEYASSRKSEEMFEEIIGNKMQRPLSLTLKKIYPLSLCEIRVLKIVKDLDKKPESSKSDSKRVGGKVEKPKEKVGDAKLPEKKMIQKKYKY